MKAALFSRPHREQNPSPHSSPAFPKVGRLTDPIHKATWQDRKERGACPLPALSFSMLRKSGCKKRDVRPGRWVSKYHFPVNQSFCSYTHTEPGNAQLMDEPQLSLATYTAFYSTSKLHTENKQPTNWKGGRKSKTEAPQFPVFLPSDSLLRREVFRTFYPL